ncbi:MAG: polysaccharide pyruvyl transferase family protein [Clostridia bacterium]|nr:polysaccharide pyruvyl transferase family protein [Clostridia bacterium]
MKIITVTSQNADNYGAVLQAYALQQTMIELGYENEILDCRPADKRSSNLKVAVRQAILKAQNIIYHSRNNKLAGRFINFRNDYLKQTKTYHSVEEVKKTPPEADAYLTGSDQVFALGNSLVPIRFLDFGPSKTVRVSYAASKGLFEKDEKSVAYLKDKLSRFTCISSREEQGTEYIKEVLGLPCQTNIDPVFLLSRDSWNKITPESRVKEPYILCFRMLRHDAFQPLVDKLKKETGWQVVSIQPRVDKKLKADKYLFDVTPQEFVQLIRDAGAVVTTSFHATALSIIFHKNFYSLIDYKPERAIALCKMFGLENRLVKKDVDDFTELNDICYDSVDSVIAQKRDEALTYLKKLENYINEKRE